MTLPKNKQLDLFHYYRNHFLFTENEESQAWQLLWKILNLTTAPVRDVHYLLNQKILLIESESAPSPMAQLELPRRLTLTIPDELIKKYVHSPTIKTGDKKILVAKGLSSYLTQLYETEPFCLILVRLNFSGPELFNFYATKSLFIHECLLFMQQRDTLNRFSSENTLGLLTLAAFPKMEAVNTASIEFNKHQDDILGWNRTFRVCNYDLVYDAVYGHKSIKNLQVLKGKD